MRHVCLLGVLVLALVNVGAVSSANPSFKGGKYAVTVLDDGTLFTFTWKLKVNRGAITGTSVSHEYPFTDPLTGTVKGSGAKIVRGCGPGARARFPNCSRQIYTVHATSAKVLKGTATGFGIVAGTTITMRLVSTP